MTIAPIATTRPTNWIRDAEELEAPVGDLRAAVPGQGTLLPHAIDISEAQTQTQGDPHAVQRWAELLHHMTGWHLPTDQSDDAAYLALAASRDQDDEAFDVAMRRRTRDR